jgi:NADH-quinone oxidoreductase subunit L
MNASWIVAHLWLIPVLPALAAGISALLSQRQRGAAAGLAIGAMFGSLLLSLCAFSTVLGHLGSADSARAVVNFNWLQFGSSWLQLGWMLDPLTAVMLVMVTFVGLCIFVFSVGYMSHDENFMRFFCFLSLFAAAMLGVLISNSLLLLFICWELVGLTSYLLIGFWYQKPSAAAAAKKAFITTRIGDIGLFAGIIWLSYSANTLLFYNNGAGAMEHGALTMLASHTTLFGMSVATAISLLIFCGAAGKSGQVPLHVWLPDAMEGPTPVSALIHAATMVAAGVFLIARVYPLMSTGPIPSVTAVVGTTTALTVVAWIGSITALFAALIAIAQNDIKRILAYSTVSQLGYMMLGLAVGGVAVGMFHLITHAFFKALLFLGAGSVIHGCHDEQDIRSMGGLRKYMPVTFAVYAVGMLALCGFPLFFSGFWSKDAILHAASVWSVSRVPFYLGSLAALLTAFYMTRQVATVFFGHYRGQSDHSHSSHESPAGHDTSAAPHESPAVMTVPLILLAIFAVLLGVLGTPLWPWFTAFLHGEAASYIGFEGFSEPGLMRVMITSSCIVFAGLGLGWWLYGSKPRESAEEADPLQRSMPGIFTALENRLYVDEFYAATVFRLNAALAWFADFLDRYLWSGIVRAIMLLVIALSHLNTAVESTAINGSFDEGCAAVTFGGRMLSHLQNGQVQRSLRAIGLALVMLLLAWFAFTGGVKA